MYCPHCGAQNDEAFKFCKTCGADLSTSVPLASAAPEEPSEVDLVRAELKDEYEILKELGRGGMAIVFHAKERLLEREVALKVLPFSLSFDKEFVERFMREARTAAKLEHPGIVPIYRVGKSGRVTYFTMKYLRGKPLSALLAARGALPPHEIRQILVQVARALAYAYRTDGTVHRDIKPDNIMFDEHGQAMVADFGIAKAASGSKLTGTGMAIGTPHYMSPEQARAQQLDGRSDIYSLGVVAYQCLTGMVPFDGEDSFSIGYKHIMEPLPIPPLETQDQIDLFEVVKKMMAKLPAERFQTADELAEILESGAGYVATGITSAQTRAIPSLAFPKLSTAPTTPLPRVSASAGLPPVPGAPARKERSTMAALLIWVLVVGGILGGGGYFAYKKGLIFAHGVAPDSVTAVHDSAQQLADSATRADSGERAGADSAPRGVATAVPGTSGRLVLLGTIPDGAQVTVDRQPVKGTSLELAPGTHKLAVQADGWRPLERSILINPSSLTSVTIELQRPTVVGGGGSNAGGGTASCDAYGPTYNRDGSCFDTRPAPLVAPRVPLPAGATDTPRLVIVLVHVSQDGSTVDARVLTPSNDSAFTALALEFAKQLKWTPAQKNGEPVDAWTQQQILPSRQ
ncbi:MAG TPA: TonB family protein [Gemmatimonadales bacterium]|nr:TonB family protein [Gemmatimonadales bacterium]